MKKTLYLFVFVSLITFAQDNAPSVELFFGTESASGYGSITFTLNKVSTVWGQDYPHSSCQNYSQEEFWIDTEDLYATGSSTVSIHNQTNFTKGLDFVGSRDNNGFYDIYGFGLYKVTTSESSSYFFIDYRDAHFACIDYGYGNVPPNGTGHHTDLWIKYNPVTNTFSYSNSGSSETFNTITNKELLQIWVIKGANTPNTSLFNGDGNYWINALALIPSTNNNPKLVWGPYPSTATGFKVYRSVNNGSFTQVGSDLPASTLQYTDFDYVIVNNNGNNLQYYVKAIISGGLSSATNTVSTSGISTLKDKSEDHLKNKYILALSANYPNPFNPSTTIDYHIDNFSFVDLKVFNSLGEEVAVLVSEHKGPGNYSVQFNGFKLSSGIYFYKLQTKENILIKTMVLLK